MPLMNFARKWICWCLRRCESCVVRRDVHAKLPTRTISVCQIGTRLCMHFKFRGRDCQAQLSHPSGSDVSCLCLFTASKFFSSHCELFTMYLWVSLSHSSQCHRHNIIWSLPAAVTQDQDGGPFYLIKSRGSQSIGCNISALYVCEEQHNVSVPDLGSLLATGP